MSMIQSDCELELFTIRKPNSYLLYCERREKEEEEAQRVFMVKQQLEEVFIYYHYLIVE